MRSTGKLTLRLQALGSNRSFATCKSVEESASGYVSSEVAEAADFLGVPLRPSALVASMPVTRDWLEFGSRIAAARGEDHEAATVS